MLFGKETKCLKIQLLKTSKCVLVMHLLTPSGSSSLHKMTPNPSKPLVPMFESLNIKENVNVKVKGRSQPLRVHVVIFARLLKLILLIAFHYSSTETIDSLYQLHPHQKKNKM